MTKGTIALVMGAILLALFVQCGGPGTPAVPPIEAPTQATQPPREEPSTPPPDTPRPEPRPTATLAPTTTPTPTPTSVPTNTPAPLAARITVDPSCSQFDSPGDDSKNKSEEYVCLRNGGDQSIRMQGWTLKDEYGWTYILPEFTLDPGATVKIRTGCGQNTATDLYWCHEGATAIWNNDGDIVFLYDLEGNLVTKHAY